MRRILETAVILIGTLGWWGFVYPELCAMEEVYEDKEGESTEPVYPWEDENRDGFCIRRGNIRIKCRAIEYLFSIREKTDNEEDESNDG